MTSGPEATRLPEPGDLVWVEFRLTLGREQSGVRPALVLTSRGFHERNATAIVCAIMRNVQSWPTEIVLPAGLAVTGAVLTDQIRNVDRAARGFRRIDRAPSETLDAVHRKIANLLGITLSS